MNGEFFIIQTIIKSITFEEFVEGYPGDEKRPSELRNGVIVERNQNGAYEEVKVFLIRKINVEIDRFPALAVRTPAYLRSQKSYFVTASLLIPLYF
ncbi:hypothetical protein [Microcoleus vaginatus]|uniref:hypothetical protein n=1 Tax=Microcoleus vaginatus TaxID=119532 RepID=UPI00020D17BD|nr:hypothetical protein MicvaDRAFT_3026 [Microcoleus vaginatus FGP-2]